MHAQRVEYKYTRVQAHKLQSVPRGYRRSTYTTGMNLLSKFCIAVSATRKLNCVAVGVICVAVFLVCFGEEKNVELRDAFPAQPVQGIKYFEGKKIVLPLQR